ncbi:MAG: hypothetical protein RL456_2723 [Pseudomonadota bacterium]
MTTPDVSAAVRARPGADRCARSAIRFDEILAATERLSRWHMGATIAYRPLADESPRQVAERLLGDLARLGGTRRAVAPQWLLQPGALGYDLALMRRVLQGARAAGVPVTLDLTVPQRTDAVLDCAAELGAVHDGLGLSLSWDRDRTLRDVDRARALGLRLRLVHERWAETGEARRVSAQAAERVIGRAAGHGQEVTLVCHEPQIVAGAAQRLREAGTPVRLELLPDLPRQGVLWVARTASLVVRSSIAYGQPQVLSLFGQAPQHPRVLWWSALGSSLGTLLPAG